jgi:hypothetical protein
MGLNINETFLHTLLLADDQILITANEYDIEYMMRKISESYDRAGLKVNFAKTKYSETSIHRSRYRRSPACIVCLIWSRN